jgi:hypothetical protein
VNNWQQQYRDNYSNWSRDERNRQLNLVLRNLAAEVTNLLRAIHTRRLNQPGDRRLNQPGDQVIFNL